jgi:hypothetical protein
MNLWDKLKKKLSKILEVIKNFEKKENKCIKARWEDLYKRFNSCRKRKI